MFYGPYIETFQPRRRHFFRLAAAKIFLSDGGPPKRRGARESFPHRRACFALRTSRPQSESFVR